ncbi:MAG: SDR family oxidoreductase [Clostridia bacterium]|nr:SDR family oxidoreductase [Clostridia bacterium]
MPNKTALITGASRGIGKAIAIELASKGFNVVINYLNSYEKAKDLAEYITKTFKVSAEIFKADISSEEEIEKLFNFCVEKFKNIDVLINNAGICYDTDLSNRTFGQFANTFKTNVFGVFYLTKLIGEHMVVNKYGKIINISSNNSINCFYPTSIDYDATKSALNSMTKNFAIEFAPYVNVVAVAPGWIETDMNKDLTPDIMELEKERILKKRIGQPKDVAKLVSFLVSDDADYINGEIIVIDGGMF